MLKGKSLMDDSLDFEGMQDFEIDYIKNSHAWGNIERNCDYVIDNPGKFSKAFIVWNLEQAREHGLSSKLGQRRKIEPSTKETQELELERQIKRTFNSESKKSIQERKKLISQLEDDLKKIENEPSKDPRRKYHNYEITLKSLAYSMRLQRTSKSEKAYLKNWLSKLEHDPKLKPENDYLHYLIYCRDDSESVDYAYTQLHAHLKDYRLRPLK